MGRDVNRLFSIALVAISAPFCAFCQTIEAPQPPRDVTPDGWSVPAVDRDVLWRDDAHRRARIDAVRGHPDFARAEARIREDLDAGLEQGWLTRDDFLIFGRQLHQIELHESSLLLRYSQALPLEERAAIHGSLDELRRQLDEARPGP